MDRDGRGSDGVSRRRCPRPPRAGTGGRPPGRPGRGHARAGVRPGTAVAPVRPHCRRHFPDHKAGHLGGAPRAGGGHPSRRRPSVRRGAPAGPVRTAPDHHRPARHGPHHRADECHAGRSRRPPGTARHPAARRAVRRGRREPRGGTAPGTRDGGPGGPQQPASEPAAPFGAAARAVTVRLPPGGRSRTSHRGRSPLHRRHRAARPPTAGSRPRGRRAGGGLPGRRAHRAGPCGRTRTRFR